MLDQQFIIETGRSQGQRGQPQTYLGANPVAGFSIGIHLDRNRVVMVVCNLLVEVIWPEKPGQTICASRNRL